MDVIIETQQRELVGNENHYEARSMSERSKVTGQDFKQKQVERKEIPKQISENQLPSSQSSSSSSSDSGSDAHSNEESQDQGDDSQSSEELENHIIQNKAGQLKLGIHVDTIKTITSEKIAEKQKFIRKHKEKNKTNLQRTQQNEAYQFQMQLINKSRDRGHISYIQRLFTGGSDITYPPFIFPINGNFKQKSQIQGLVFFNNQLFMTRKIWDIMISIIGLLSGIFTPIQIAFDPPGLENLLLNIFDISSVTFFILDFLLNFRTTYLNQNYDEVINPQKIAINYMQSKYFMLDLLCSVPMNFLFGQIESDQYLATTAKWTKFGFSVFKILRISKISKVLQSMDNKLTYDFLKIIFTFIMSFHWITCIWFFIVSGEKGNNDQNSWIPSSFRNVGFTTDDQFVKLYYDEFSNTKIYAFTLYSLINLTLGSDIAPTTHFQANVASFLCLCGAYLLATLFGELAVIATQMLDKDSEKNELITNLDFQMIKNNIPNRLRVQALEYLNYIWEKQKILNFTKNLQDFSKGLQKSIHEEIHANFFNRIPIFKKLNSNQLIWLINNLQTEVFLPGEIIIRKGDKGDEMFFITEGYAQIIIDLMSAENQKMYRFVYQKKGQYFGEIALFVGSRRTANIEAIDFTICEILNRETFQKLSSNFPGAHLRLLQGIQLFQSTKIQEIIQLISIKLFQQADHNLLLKFVDRYLDTFYLDQNQVILSPKRKVNALYILLIGNISQFEDSENNKQFIRALVGTSTTDLFRSQNNTNSFNNQIESNVLSEEVIQSYKPLEVLSPGDFFQCMFFKNLKLVLIFNQDFPNDILDQCQHYYVSLTAVQIGVVTEKSLQDMMIYDPKLYKKLLRVGKQMVNYIGGNQLRTVFERKRKSIKTMHFQFNSKRQNTIIDREVNKQDIQHTNNFNPIIKKIADQNEKSSLILENLSQVLNLLNSKDQIEDDYVIKRDIISNRKLLKNEMEKKYKF